jgi:soluble lytic murein transglycosylase-like protein
VELRYVGVEPRLVAATRKAAEKWGLPRKWLMAQILHESGYNPYAKRVEPGFLERYGHTVAKLARKQGNRTAGLWLRAPLDFNASYGLMQVMWSTAVERGFTCTYPSELFDIDLNLEYGCAELHRQLVKADGDLGVALDAYNDGRINARNETGDLVDHDYTDRILAAYQEMWGYPFPTFPMIDLGLR